MLLQACVINETTGKQGCIKTYILESGQNQLF